MPEPKEEGNNLSRAEAEALAAFRETLEKLKAEGTLSPRLHQQLVQEAWRHYPLPARQSEEAQAEETPETVAKPAARKSTRKARSTGAGASTREGTRPPHHSHDLAGYRL